VRPTVMAIFDNIEDRVVIVTPVWPSAGLGADAAYDLARERLADVVADFDRGLPHRGDWRGAGTLPEPASNVTRGRYHEMVEQAKEYIRAGDVFQVVPSQRFTVPFDLPPFALYRALRRLNPSPFLFFLDFAEFALVGSSPEILVRLRDDTVVIRPIAGTRRRGATRVEDAALAADMLGDPKELAEHLMLLDLGRNDVGRVAEIGSVRVTEKMVVEYYSHVMHIVSNVEGRIRPDKDALDALIGGFPAGTVSGAPKVRAMEIIDELEPVKRGVYAGAVGYLGFHGNMDVAIALRTAIIKDGMLHVQAGGGIVINGRVVVGANAIAGEWGHNALPWPEADERPGEPCYCGRRGCIGCRGRVQQNPEADRQADSRQNPESRPPDAPALRGHGWQRRGGCRGRSRLRRRSSTGFLRPGARSNPAHRFCGRRGQAGDRRRGGTRPIDRPPQSRGQRSHHRVRLEPELFAEQGLVQPRVLQRSGPVAGMRQRGHEPYGGGGVQRADDGKALAPFDLVARSPCAFSLARETLQRADHPVLQPCALARGPLLEFAAARQVEAVGEGTGVQGRGPLVIPGSQRLLQLPHVALEPPPIQPKVASTLEEILGLQGLARGVERLGQRMTGAFLAGFGPEQRDQLVATEAALACDGEDDQQRKQAALAGRAGQRLPLLIGDVHTPKCPQSQHLDSI